MGSSGSPNAGTRDPSEWRDITAHCSEVRSLPLLGSWAKWPKDLEIWPWISLSIHVGILSLCQAPKLHVDSLYWFLRLEINLRSCPSAKIFLGYGGLINFKRLKNMIPPPWCVDETGCGFVGLGWRGRGTRSISVFSLSPASSLPMCSTLPLGQAPGVGCSLPNVEQVDVRHLG